MDFAGVKPDLVKFEMRQSVGRPAWAEPVKKRGFFGRLLSGVGKFFGALAAPFSYVFPPAALAAAGMYGLGQIGDQIQYKAYQKMMKDQSQGNLSNVSFPGLDFSQMGPMPASASGVSPAGVTSMSPHNAMVMDVLFARGSADIDLVHRI